MDVVIKNGKLMRNKASEIARFKMYKFVTVFILAKRSTTYITSPLPMSPMKHIKEYEVTRITVMLEMALGMPIVLLATDDVLSSSSQYSSESYSYDVLVELLNDVSMVTATEVASSVNQILVKILYFALDKRNHNITGRVSLTHCI